jgi:RNA polymerase II subunit A-like phosphatase
MFGARCVRALDQRITHLVVAQADTQKVAQALKQPSTKVVWKEWLRHSIDWCQRQPEEAYQVSSFGRPDRSAPSTPTKKQNAPIEPVQTTPSTPSVQERTEPVHMDVTDFDDIDDELKEFMEDDDDEDDEDDATTVDGSESGMSEQRYVVLV